jgi:AcrR family transcriptional regulator
MDRTSPPTRAERQRETRAALLAAAREGFARDGYHGANLEAIANEAGFSKGAVYSNFDGKADLFLAVIDDNLDALRGGGWDPFETDDRADVDTGAAADPGARPEAGELDLRGFALATLEFIAVAGRDGELDAALRARVERMVDAYTAVARTAADPDDALTTDELGVLLAALDQGISLLALAGLTSPDADLLRVGLQRLVAPARAATTGRAGRGRVGGAIHDVEVQRRLREHVDT